MLKGKETLTRILLVDDVAVVRAGLRALLESEADMVVVGEAATAETAVTQAHLLTPDLVVLDMVLPDYDGLNVIKTLRLHYPQIRILVLSNLGEVSIIQAAVAAGAQGYLIKGQDSHYLGTAVRIVMAGTQVLYPGSKPNSI